MIPRSDLVLHSGECLLQRDLQLIPTGSIVVGTPPPWPHHPPWTTVSVTTSQRKLLYTTSHSKGGKAGSLAVQGREAAPGCFGSKGGEPCNLQKDHGPVFLLQRHHNQHSLEVVILGTSPDHVAPSTAENTFMVQSLISIHKTYAWFVPLFTKSHHEYFPI